MLVVTEIRKNLYLKDHVQTIASYSCNFNLESDHLFCVCRGSSVGGRLEGDVKDFSKKNPGTYLSEKRTG